MRKILIISILILLFLIPVSSAIEVRTDISNDNIKVYKLAKIKTTETTGGSAFCFPGLFRSMTLIGPILFHSFVVYDDDYWEGWYLTINGDKVSRGQGYIFGFTGRITNWYGGLGFKPDYRAFDLDGIALLIIHISD
ncbi:hypothetical protein AYK21_02935 [Thermoplasmatales archaeon SG8-52-2]|nr:MAG: hypothetical protein AYK21_02935 [Thermoplasmatales archaeon SG8-52-2]